MTSKKGNTDAMQEGQEEGQQEGRRGEEEVADEKPLRGRTRVVFKETLSGGIKSINSEDTTKTLEVVYDRNHWPRGVIVSVKRTRAKYTVPLSNINEFCED